MVPTNFISEEGSRKYLANPKAPPCLSQPHERPPCQTSETTTSSSSSNGVALRPSDGI